jgi:23S rRNA (cytidine1920-2'-O)/16S rRNA (cytidine1409-2'-O)-methyltransferase
VDVELVRRGLVSSRARAVDAITAGRVLAGGAPVTNAARQVAPDEPLVVLAPVGETYVSRGGHKLARALDAFSVDVNGRNALDVGASTGGFTDCLLHRGAAHVVAVDVGHGQLDWALRQDARVTVMERTNVRALAALPMAVDVCVVDVSFISLRTIAAHLLALTEPDTDFVLLVKPQYEAGRARVPRRGVVRDQAVHAAVLREVVAGLDAAGLGVQAVVPSPIRGADGNVEFLAHGRRGHATVTEDALDDAVRRAQEAA